MSLIKPFVRLASSIFPKPFADKAFDKLVNPQIHRLRPHEEEVLEEAEKNDLAFRSFKIKTYTWNRGNEPVLLIHGWEGQAGNFADLIEHLVKSDFTVYAFDGPSHGFSSTGETSLLEFKDLVAIMIEKTGAKKLVSHSFGGVATTAALFENTDLEIEKYALLTTPDRFTQRLDQVSEQFGISRKVKNELAERMEKLTGVSVKDLNVSDWVKAVNVREARIWHDKDDRVIGADQSRGVNAAWSNSSLVEVEGTGHFRILRTESVLEEVTAFLATTS